MAEIRSRQSSGIDRLVTTVGNRASLRSRRIRASVNRSCRVQLATNVSEPGWRDLTGRSKSSRTSKGVVVNASRRCSRSACPPLAASHRNSARRSPSRSTVASSSGLRRCARYPHSAVFPRSSPPTIHRPLVWRLASKDPQMPATAALTDGGVPASAAESRLSENPRIHRPDRRRDLARLAARSLRQLHGTWRPSVGAA